MRTLALGLAIVFALPLCGQSPAATPVSQAAPNEAPTQSPNNTATQSTQSNAPYPYSVVNVIPTPSPQNAPGIGVGQASLIAAITDALATIIVCGVNIWHAKHLNRVTQAQELRTHIRDLAVQLALEQYRRAGEVKKQQAALDQSKGLPSFMEYGPGELQGVVLEMLAFADSLSEESNMEAIRSAVKEKYKRQEDWVKAFNAANAPKAEP